ncbi:protein phosphatase 2C domain-containing protein [Nocardia cyriacigeorgica]|nr:protein phosphatase 2C domain-containing protein [Nocardia cyriacigeorgica]
MRIAAAQLAARADEDRVVLLRNGTILLDGASSFDPETPSAARYVDVLAGEMARRVSETSDLKTALAESLIAVSQQLDLRPGKSPSSTVAVARVGERTLDVLVLGDSAIVVGLKDGSCRIFLDDRLAALELPEAGQYITRLRSGGGYDDTHRAILQRLQRRQLHMRNRPGGYWIAESEPAAAHEAITAGFPLYAVSWVISATDGAFDLLPVTGLDWQEIARMSNAELHDLLVRLRRWESDVDPNGRRLPRSKQHDDKSIAVVDL